MASATGGRAPQPSPAGEGARQRGEGVLPRRQRGAVGILFAIVTALALIAVMGLVIDLGGMFVARTEVQNAMDACSLAAAKELNGANPNQLQIAENAGITVGNRNRVSYQSGNIALAADTDVTFSETLDGTYRTRTAVSAAEVSAIKFARCTWTRSGIPMMFMQVMGVGPQNVAATAVATLRSSMTNCAIPVALCDQKLTPDTCPAGMGPDAIGRCRGRWYQGIADPGGAATGSYRWANLDPDASGGAKDIKNVLSGASGGCDLPAKDAEIGNNGYKAGVTAAWNTRFGIYSAGFDSTSSPHDATGHSYYYDTTGTPYGLPPTAGTFPDFNVFADFTSRRGSHDPYQGDAASGLNTAGSVDTTPADNDRRMVILPVVNCDGFEVGTKATVVAYACMVMLHPLHLGAGSNPMWLEYRGTSTAPESTCSTTGTPGGPGATGPLVSALVR